MKDTGANGAKELTSLLEAIDLRGPYILVAHSYGGCIAREFLQMHKQDVVGMVLCETGTETKCENHEEQYRVQILGDKPLSVLRGEAAFEQKPRKQEHETEELTNVGESIKEQTEAHRKMLAATKKMDEDLKREQLKLSRNSRFRNVPHCGHNLHTVRPDIVAEEIRWVLENAKLGTESLERSAVIGTRGESKFARFRRLLHWI